jgi:hypothetical protein
VKRIVLEKYLKELNESINYDDIEQFMTEQCIPFAVALSEIFPEYKIACINNSYELDEDEESESEYNYDFVHAFCYHPQNHKIIVDAKGIRKLNDLYDDFWDITPDIDWDIPNSEYLINEYAGKQFYSEESFEFDKQYYIFAKKCILDNKPDYDVNFL